MALFSNKQHRHDGRDERRIRLSDLILDPVVYLEIAHIYSGNMGLGTTEPGLNVAGGAADYTGLAFHAKSAASEAHLIAEGNVGAYLDLIDLAGAANEKIMQLEMDAGVLAFRALHDDLTVHADNIFVIDQDTAKIGQGTVAPGENLIGTGSIAGLCFHQYNNDVAFNSGRVNLFQEGIGGVWNVHVDLNGGVNEKAILTVLDADIAGNEHWILKSLMDDRTTRVDNALVYTLASGNFGMGTAEPGLNVAGGTADIVGLAFHAKTTASEAHLVAEGVHGGFVDLIDYDAGADVKVLQAYSLAEVGGLRALNDDLSVHSDVLSIALSTGIATFIANVVAPTFNGFTIAHNSHDAATVVAAPLTIAGQAITFNYDSNDFQLSGNNLQVKDGGISHDGLADVSANDHHNQSHNHSAAGDGTRVTPAEFKFPLAVSASPVAGDAYFDDSAGAQRLAIYSAADATWVFVALA